MTRNTFRIDPAHALGLCGLLLMLIVAKLVPIADARATTPSDRLRRMLARRGVDAIAGVGWLVDSWPARAHARNRQAEERRPVVPGSAVRSYVGQKRTMASNAVGALTDR